MTDSRSSFDVRAERLSIIASKVASPKAPDSPARTEEAGENVEDWIKGVRALKEKRRLEDESRNRQLEEDILRERRARQARRVTRGRSLSPTKSQPGSPGQGSLGTLRTNAGITSSVIEDATKVYASNVSAPDAASEIQRDPDPLFAQGQLERPVELLTREVGAHSSSSKHSPEMQKLMNARRHGENLETSSAASKLLKRTPTGSAIATDSLQNRSGQIPPSPESHDGKRLSSPVLSPRLERSSPRQSIRESRPDGAITTSRQDSLKDTSTPPKSFSSPGLDNFSAVRQGLRSVNAPRPVSERFRDALLPSKTSFKPPGTSPKPSFLDDLRSRPSVLPNSKKTSDASSTHLARQDSAPLSSNRPEAPVGPISRHESLPVTTKAKQSAMSLNLNPGLAALLRRGPPVSSSKSRIGASNVVSSSNEEGISATADKLSHMTKNRARRPKTKVPTKLEAQRSPSLDTEPEHRISSSPKPVKPWKQNTTVVQEEVSYSNGDPHATIAAVDHPVMTRRLDAHKADAQKQGRAPADPASNSLAEKIAQLSLKAKDKSPPESPSNKTKTEPLLDDPDQSLKRLETNALKSIQDAQPVINRSPFASRSTSPFKKSAYARHAPMKSMASMTDMAQLIRGRADVQMNGEPRATEHKESGKSSLEVWQIHASSSNRLTSSKTHNTLHANGMLLFKSARKGRWYRWIGAECGFDGEEPVGQIVAPDSEIMDVRMHEEPSEFLGIFSDSTIICKYSSQSAVTDQLYCVKQYMDGFVVNQVSCSAASLCSGFVFVLARSFGAIIVWIGKGSFAGELEAAKKVFPLQKDSTTILDTCSEGQEPDSFWSQLGGQTRYASSSYWRLRKDFPSYKNDLWTVKSSLVKQQKIWSFRSLSSGQVHIIDCFFEIYVYLTPASRKEDIRKALEWIKAFSSSLGSSRPFIPMVLILCPRSKFPRDLKALFRDTVHDGAELRVLELESAELLLDRSTFRYSELQSGTIIGYNPDRIDQCIDPRDFELAMGLSQQTFQRLSALEQEDVRKMAFERFTSGL